MTTGVGGIARYPRISAGVIGYAHQRLRPGNLRSWRPNPVQRPLRFCMVTTFYPPYSFGGDGIFVQRLSNELAARGHHVSVIHCIDAFEAKGGKSVSLEYEDHPNVSVHGLRSPFGVLSPLATQQTGLPLMKRRQIRAILDEGFDVIHYHNISLIGGPGVLAYGSGIKLYTMHEYWLGCPTHVLFRFNRAPCERRHCLACTLSYRRPPQLWRYSGLLKAAVRNVDLFLSLSRFSEEMHRTMGLDLPVVRLPLFAPEPQAPVASELSIAGEHAPYFLFVGRLERLKGLHTLIPIFQTYDRAQLLIAGSGSEEGSLRRLAAGSPNIRFLGRVTSAQLSAFYRDAVAVIVPSICYEGFPLVAVEALSHGTPVIVRELGGMVDSVADSGAGYTYQTEEELFAAMDHLVDEPDRRRMLGVRGIEAYRRNWSPEAHISRYLTLIDQIADRKAREEAHGAISGA